MDGLSPSIFSLGNLQNNFPEIQYGFIANDLGIGIWSSFTYITITLCDNLGRLHPRFYVISDQRPQLSRYRDCAADNSGNSSGAYASSC